MCFSLAWLLQLLIWLIVIGAVVAILNLLIPWLTSFTGQPIIGQVLKIVLYAVIAIAVLIVIFDLFSCLLGYAPLSLPRAVR